MPKQMIEIDVPEGWECVGWRYVREGESFLDRGNIHEWEFGKPSHDKYPILRRAWAWPAWLTAPWIARNRNRKLLAYDTKPYIADALDSMWTSDGSSIELNPDLLAFTPPPCDDWTQSLRENPNHKENT